MGYIYIKIFFNIPRNRRLRYILIILSVWLSVRLSAQGKLHLGYHFEPNEIGLNITHVHFCDKTFLLVPNIFPRDLYLDF